MAVTASLDLATKGCPSLLASSRFALGGVHEGRAGMIPSPPSTRKEVLGLWEGDKSRERKEIKAGGQWRR